MEPLNGPLEVGVRALLLLEATHPKSLDISRLSLMDHALIHSGDFGGPESILPAIPGRSSELGIKRERIEEGLRVMLRAELVALVADAEGIRYVASDNASSFIELLEADLIADLRERAVWAANTYLELSDSQVSRLIVQYSSSEIGPYDESQEQSLPGTEEP